VIDMELLSVIRRWHYRDRFSIRDGEMRLARSGSADQDGIALLSDEAAAGEIAHQRLVDRRVLECEVVDVLGQRQLGDRELVLDRARLLFRDLGLQEIADEAQDYFADGVTENLTTALARIRDSFVIARNTAFTFKGKALNAKAIGKELGVRYVLEGSVQRDQNRVRVNAQLIDAQSGAHLWADRFEEDVADLFKLQDQVVARLANTLGFELVRAEARRDEHIAHPDAFDLTMRGSALLLQSQLRGRRRITTRSERCTNGRSPSTLTIQARWRATPLLT
jgi:TolB-like protein